MRRRISINFLPSKFILYGLLIYFALFLVGPYKYTIYSVEGLFYFILAFIFLFVGAFIGERSSNQKSFNYKIYLSKKAEMFILFLIIISFLSFLAYLFYILKVEGSNFEYAMGDIRQNISENRPIWHKIAEILMDLGIVIFLIVSSLSKTNFKVTKLFSVIVFLLPSFALLAIGARGKAVMTIILFIIAYLLQKKRGINNGLNKGFGKVFILLAVIIFIYFIMQLFSVRGIDRSIYNTFLLYPGDMEIKPFYEWLFTKFPFITETGKMWIYYTHSFPFFTWLFDNSDYTQLAYGAFQFRIFGFLLQIIGIPFINYIDIVHSQVFYGYYPTFIQGFLLDWGPIYGLLFILFNGLLLGFFSVSNKRYGFGYFIFPLILTMCFIAPIYYFWHISNFDWVIFLYFPIYFMIKILGVTKEKA